MINIIGAGPAGSYAAYLLAKRGYEVNLFEEHKTIGSPVQCTGILTQGINKFFKPSQDSITNKIPYVKVHSQNQSTEIKLRKPDIIVNRTLFDQSIADQAHDAGTNVHTSHRFIDKKGEKIIIKNIENNKTKELSQTHLIGADGPNSQVAKAEHMKGKRTFFYGAQATIKGDFDPDCYEVYLGSVCPDLFAWVVPEDKHHARAGLASFTKTNHYFQAFLKKLGSPKICACQGGLIPFYNNAIQTQKNNTYLIGDAAFQVKATTAGGIIQGLTAAQAASTAIEKNQSYENLWKKALQKDLWLHLLIRNMMRKFKDADFDQLIKLVRQERVKKIIETHDRDYPTKFLLRLGLKEPRFAYFTRFLLGL